MLFVLKNTFFYLLRITWEYAREQRRKLGVTYGMFFVANLVDAVRPLVFGLILNAIQLGGEGFLVRVLWLLGLYYVLPFFFWIFNGNARVFERQISFIVTKNFQETLFSRILQLPLQWHKDHHSGDTIDRLKKATNALRNFSEMTFANIDTLMRFLGSLTAIVIISPWLGFGAVTFGVVIVFAIVQYDVHLVSTQEMINDREHIVASTVHDYITNSKTVITLRLRELAQKEVVKKILAIFPIYRKNIVFNELKWFSVEMLLSLMSFLLMAVYIWQQTLVGSVLLLGTIAMMYQYVERFKGVFYSLAWQYENVVRQSTDVRSIEPIMKAFESLGVLEQFDDKHPLWKSITVQKLQFRYEDEHHQAHTLRDIRIDMARGKKIALVGESGSGKSTLLTLLRGLMDVDYAEVDIDGMPFSSIRILSSLTTLIPQDPEIFENTIAYNITAGVVGEKGEIEQAARLACFDQVVAGLPQRYETDIKERGVNLSGGEKQRLALARGIFAARDSSIVLLDEPTSSVDTGNELIIYKQLFEYFSDRCVISSIHKLHLLPLFDEVYVLVDGELVERGSFHELIGMGGVLGRMWKVYGENG